MKLQVNNNRPLTGSMILRWAIALAVLTAVVMIACSFVGHYKFQDVDSWRFWEWPIWGSRIWSVRIYRLAAAAVIGSTLAISGMALQALLRNPLADPFVLGISSGAGVGVMLGRLLAIATLLPIWLSSPLLASIGAVVTALVVFVLAQKGGYLNPYSLLLSGVIVNIMNSALVQAIFQFVRKDDVIFYTAWQTGSIPENLWSSPGLLWLGVLVAVGGGVYLMLRASAYNILSLGDDIAASGGVNIHRLRIETFAVISVMTGISVALAGPIGFVGLIIPHACRMVVGPDHRLLTVVTFFSGAIFLMLADTACRLIGQWLNLGELPVGVITALIGGPFFLYLLKTRFAESTS